MAEKIPLNLYKRITKKLKRIPEQVYNAPLNRASTIISVIGSNITSKDRFLSLSLSSANINEEFLTVPNIFFRPLEYNSVLPSKIVITENDEIIGSADIEDKATINDEGLFWLYDVPTTITEVGIQIGFTQSTSITADFEVGDIPYNQRLINSNFGPFVSAESTFLSLTSFVPVSYVYDLSNETDVNITLSILESNNTQ
jgi:hypothetical protein